LLEKKKRKKSWGWWGEGGREVGERSAEWLSGGVGWVVWWLELEEEEEELL
jgi:hypothetical protein